jgi:signal transduction histidine kinase
MNVNDILTFNTQILFIALTIFALVDYARRGGAPRRDFFLFALALGLPLGITFARRFWPLQSSFLNLAGAFALFSQPYFLFRLLHYSRPHRRRIGMVILVGFLLCCVLLLNRMAADPALTVTIIFSYCTAAEAYTTWGFYQGRKATSGTLRRRLTIITVSSGVFTIAFLINALRAPFPGLAIGPVAQAAAAISAILFYAAFVPPRWLRRAWQMEELRGYLSQVKIESLADDFVTQNLEQLSQMARQVTNGLAAGVLNADKLTPPVLAATDPAIFERLSSLNPSFLTQVWESRMPTWHSLSGIPDAYQRQQLEMLGAQTWLLIPIQNQNHVWGLLIVALSHRSLFIDDDLDALELLTQECVLILDNHRLIDELQASVHQLTATLEERQRIARRLHDALTQTLFTATITAEALPRILPRNPDRGVEQAHLIGRLNRAMMAELQTLLHDLRPEMLLRTSLSTLMQQLIDAAKGRKNIEGSIVVEGSESDIPAEVRTVFFRIAQECVNNIVNHSEATAYTIHLQIGPQNVQMRIHDNGKGFDTQAAGEGFGLGIMRERAEAIRAALSIQSQPHDGTTVVVMWKNENTVAA